MISDDIEMITGKQIKDEQEAIYELFREIKKRAPKDEVVKLINYLDKGANKDDNKQGNNSTILQKNNRRYCSKTLYERGRLVES